MTTTVLWLLGIIVGIWALFALTSLTITIWTFLTIRREARAAQRRLKRYTDARERASRDN